MIQLFKRTVLTALLFVPLCTFATDYTDEAITYPLAFAQVREDPTQDRRAIEQFFPEGNVSMLMIASGGETAAYLAGSGTVDALTIVDPNPAQIELAKLKLHLLSYPVEKRMELLGYQKISQGEREELLASLMSLLDIPEDVFGVPHADGLDYSGRYERVFVELQKELRLHTSDLANLFRQVEIDKQAALVAPGTVLGDALDQALDQVMSQDNLVKIFGEKATANRVQEFSRHFAGRIRIYLQSHLASQSPFLAQMLLGDFVEDTRYEWLNLPAKPHTVPVAYANSFMNDYLAQSEAAQFDVIHLSNILDWLTPEEAQETLSLAYRALKPDGIVVIRQLNSNIDIPSMSREFNWDLETSSKLHADDLSFFYRNFFVGVKPHVSTAPIVMEMADEVLANRAIMEGPFFTTLRSGEMSVEQFAKAQEQFFYAVDYFSRPMAALVSKLPTHAQRIDILHNVVEEHGDFDAGEYHSNTFKAFLNSIGVDTSNIEQTPSGPGVLSFNTALMGAALSDDPLVAIGALGIIEYAFADISAEIGNSVIQRGWVSEKDLFHYNLHSELDKRHSEEFFAIAEPYIHNPEDREKILAGLRLGAYIFNQLYEDMYWSSLSESS